MGMSIHHSHSAVPDETTVSLPLAVITVDSYDVLTVALDGAEYPAPSPKAPSTRGRFGELLGIEEVPIRLLLRPKTTGKKEE